MNKGSKLLWTGALALSLVGCSSGTSDTSASAGRKTLNLAKENDVITMDSTLATDGMSFEVINMTIEGLETTDENGDIVPALAESYDVSEDGLTYTFHLRDASWDNGDPVTAADFEYAWKDAASDPTSDYAYIFGTDGACIKGAGEAMGNPETKTRWRSKPKTTKHSWSSWSEKRRISFP